MGTVIHTEPLAAPQIQPGPALTGGAEPSPYADGAGIVHGVLLGAALWLIVFAVGFLLMW